MRSIKQLRTDLSTRRAQRELESKAKRDAQLERDVREQIDEAAKLKRTAWRTQHRIQARMRDAWTLPEWVDEENAIERDTNWLLWGEN